MAATTTTKSFLFKQHSSTPKVDPFSSNSLFVIPALSKPSPTTTATLQTSHKKFITKASATAKKETISDESVQQVHSIEEFDVALQTAKKKLVVTNLTKQKRFVKDRRLKGFHTSVFTKAWRKSMKKKE
ncbi:hypothetical protein C5167_012215 [Papaver somniferum]|uniref:Uncharacterized protein n=1 Tax=Papaver somniferum TaxID=3469 RepID=A0A4Y7J018_PAPSO|nr:uncharacterized protein LOC113360976 isoform X2 [Papaver somniferum]RZC53362.1 hypothetical protein C5167_012215 [Papaver somniferum]